MESVNYAWCEPVKISFKTLKWVFFISAGGEDNKIQNKKKNSVLLRIAYHQPEDFAD